MDEPSKENANPTILSVSQLPTRKQPKQQSRTGPEYRYDAILFPNSDRSWAQAKPFTTWSSDEDYDAESDEEPIDEQEIYDLISSISDPEHPHTLGQLSVVNLPDIHIAPSPGGRLAAGGLATVLVELTPTVNHCSLATVIGLAVRVRLEHALPPHFRVDVRMKDGSHAQDDQVNKQLSDKERVAAALENDTLKKVLDDMLQTCV